MIKIAEIKNIMQNIEYGYLDQFKKPITEDDSNFEEEYRLQSPNITLKYRIGLCWDQVELERELFIGYDFKTYYIVIDNDINKPTHTFLVFKDNNKYYWFENSWEEYRGIHEYSNLLDLYSDIANKHLKLSNINNLDETYIYEYKKPNYKITCEEFMIHCVNGEEIKWI